MGGQPAETNKILSALRRRFPGSGEAAIAAYTLGVDAFYGGRYGTAQRWFQTYLGEQPGGRLAAEALGRLMECQSRGGQGAAARGTARRYLAAYPQGAHADLARRLVGRKTSASPEPPSGR